MIFYNDFIQRVNLIGLPIHCDTASRFAISRLRRVFARALPGSRTASAPGRQPISRAETHKVDSVPGIDMPIIRARKKTAPSSIENRKDETQKRGRYECAFGYSTREAKITCSNPEKDGTERPARQLKKEPLKAFYAASCRSMQES